MPTRNPLHSPFDRSPRRSAGRAFFIVAALALTAPATSVASAMVDRLPHPRAGVVPVVRDEVVVQFREDISIGDLESALHEAGLEIDRLVVTRDRVAVVRPADLRAFERGAFKLGIRADRDQSRVVTLIRMLESLGITRSAVPNAIVTADGGKDKRVVPNDPLYPEQWHFPLLDAEHAWTHGWGKSKVRVAILDTGVNDRYKKTFHRKFHKHLWDFVDEDDDPDDENGHGTHIAGIIGARTDDHEGVAAMAPKVTLMPLRVLDENGVGTLDALIAALDWAIEEKADVINMSFSFVPGYDPGPILHEQIQRAHAAGIVLVASTGNEGVSIVPYPAAYNEVIAVGAVDQYGGWASYSNYGWGLDVVAPGGLPLDEDDNGDPDAILSISFDPSDPDHQIGYWWGTGTSQAAPQVAGLAALLLSHEDLEPTEVEEIILGTALYLGESQEFCATGMTRDEEEDEEFEVTNCWDPHTGYGLVDAAMALDTYRRLGDGVRESLPGFIDDYDLIPTIYPPGFFGVIANLPEGLLVLLQDETGLFAFVDHTCDSRELAGEAIDDHRFETVCEIAQYLISDYRLEDLLSLEGGLIAFIENNGGLIAFLENNGALLGTIANNGGLLGMIANNGGILQLIENNGGILGLLDNNGAILAEFRNNGGLIAFLENNGAILATFNNNGGILGMLSQNGGLLATFSNNGRITRFLTPEGEPTHGLEAIEGVGELVPSGY